MRKLIFDLLFERYERKLLISLIELIVMMKNGIKNSWSRLRYIMSDTFDTKINQCVIQLNKHSKSIENKYMQKK